MELEDRLGKKLGFLNGGGVHSFSLRFVEAWLCCFACSPPDLELVSTLSASILRGLVSQDKLFARHLSHPHDLEVLEAWR